MTKAAPLAIISSLPVILGYALLGATEARAVPYEVTIVPEGTTVVATSNEGGEINTTGLTNTFDSGPTPPVIAVLWPNTGRLEIGSGPLSVRSLLSGTFSGPRTFGTTGRVDGISGSIGGPQTGILLTNVSASIASDQVEVPLNYASGTPLDISTATFPGTFASLGLTPGTFRWSWGAAEDQSFTINVVPGPIVGAGLPGLIAALGGLVAMARRRRKQLA